VAEIPVFAHLGIVDVPLAANPPQQGLLLLRYWITTEFGAYLHRANITYLV
jgi:hypothetical protein